MVQRATAGDRTTEWVFRHCHPEHTDLRATLEASRDHDGQGRFHVRGEFGAVYVAAEIDTALAELDHRAAMLGLTRAELLPRVLLTLELSLQRILNLTDGDVRTEWGLSEGDLGGDDYARCQEVARGAE